MPNASAWRYRKFSQRLVHVSQRRQGIPEPTLAWVEEYFGKSKDVQRLLGRHNAMKPEIETAVAVIEQLKRAGVVTRTKKGRA